MLLLVPVLAGVGVAVWRGPFADQRASSVAALVLAGLAWLACVFLARRLPASNTLVLVLWVGALALRLVVWFGDARLSDDVYRYVWEGGLVAEGSSPYAHAPADPGRAAERERWPEIYLGVNHPHVSAAYPPLTQAVFGAVVALSGGPGADGGKNAIRGMRATFLLADLVVLWLLTQALRRRGRHPMAAVVWGWSPLVALEFTGSGHFDSLGIACMVGALVSLRAGGRARIRSSSGARAVAFELPSLRLRAALLLAAGSMVKILPAALLPIVARKSARPLLTLAGFCLGLVLLACPVFLLDGGEQGLLRGLTAYGLQWESFSLVPRVLAAALKRIAGAGVAGADSGLVLRVLLAGTWLLILAGAWRRRVGSMRMAAYVLGGFLLLTPTLHPWYLTWMLPILVFVPSLAWTLLIAAAPLLYWPLTEWQRDGQWIEPGWLWPSLTLPFLLLLGIELYAQRRARSDLPEGEPA